MFSNVMVGMITAVASAAWVYNKVQRRTGGNTQNSLIVAGFAGLVAFILVVTLLNIIFN